MFAARPIVSTLAPFTLLVVPCSAQAPQQVWDRQAEWVYQPATSHGTTIGNPAADSQGNLVWHHEYATGGALGSANPWFDGPHTPMTWDSSWFGADGVWSYADNDGCLIRVSRLTHQLSAGAAGDHQWVPVVSWENATTQDFDVRVTGTLLLSWSGFGNAALDTDVDVVVLHRDGTTGASTLLFSQTVPKPTPGSTPESLLLEIDLPAVQVERGDRITWTMRGRDSATGSFQIFMQDRLRLIRTEVGAGYCGPSAVNSTGLGSLLAGYGSSAVSDNELTLLAFHVPHQSFGYFLTSRTQGFVANPAGSDGNLCLSGSIGRFVGPGQIQNSGNSHIVPFTVDLTQMPSPSAGLVAAQAGESWSFQYWFRDVGSTSNFSSGLELTLQ